MILGLNFKKFIRHAYRSPKWNSVRKEHLAMHPYCAACGKNKKVEVHHIEPVHINPSRELDPENLLTLCDNPCHIVFGHLLNYKYWNKDVVRDCRVYFKKILSFVQ